jgi:hypothetical protein
MYDRSITTRAFSLAAALERAAADDDSLRAAAKAMHLVTEQLTKYERARRFTVRAAAFPQEIDSLKQIAAAVAFDNGGNQCKTKTKPWDWGDPF